MLRYLWPEGVLPQFLSLRFSNEVLLLLIKHPVLAETAEQGDQTRHIVVKEVHVSAFTEEPQIVALRCNYAVQSHKIIVTYFWHFDIWLHMKPFDRQQRHPQIIECDMAIVISTQYHP